MLGFFLFSEDFPSSGVLLQRGDEPPVDKGVFDTRLAGGSAPGSKEK